MARKVTMGTLVVIKVEIKDGLYEMIGETNVKEHVVGLMAEIDKVIIWHNQLGHISEKGL